MFEPGIIIGFIGAFVGLGSLVWTIISGIRKGRVETDQSKLALYALVDARVDDNLRDAYKEIDDLKRRVLDVEKREAAALKENVQIRNIVRRWFAHLVRWDSDGRKGKMPLPAEADMALLELETA